MTHRIGAGTAVSRIFCIELLVNYLFRIHIFQGSFMKYSVIANRCIGMFAVVANMILLQQGAVKADFPCDIYEEDGVKCVAAYSTVRVLSSTYDGPLYQVRRKSDNQTKDIGMLPTGFANSEEQDDFLNGGAGTISKIYDQSGKGNDLTVAKKGCYEGTAGQNDHESDANGRKLMVGGHNVYALYMKAQDGYRSNQEGYSGYPARVEPGNGMPTGNEAQGIYEVADGKRVGGACCWDFGNASTDNCHGPTGQMNTLFFGTGYWGKGAGRGPWFMNDMEAGVWAGGSGSSNYQNNNNPSAAWDFAVGMTKTSTDGGQPKYAIRVGNAKEGDLVTAWDGNAPSTWKMEGGVVLGVGGDNSNSSFGTFFEGCITAGRPSDEADEAILKNIQDAGYGSDKVATFSGINKSIESESHYNIHYNPSNASAVITYTLEKTSRVRMMIFDQRGRQVATLTIGRKNAGRHEVYWSAQHQAPGVYVARVLLDNTFGWAQKIIVR
jgi:hypothetical protein